MKRREVIENENLYDFQIYMKYHKYDRSIREAFVNLIIKRVERVKYDGFYVGDAGFDYEDSDILIEVLCDKEKYNLSDETIDKIINILTSSNNYNGKDKIIEDLLDSDSKEFYINYGEKLVNSARSLFLEEKEIEELTNIFTTDIIQKTKIGADLVKNGHYPIYKYVDDILEMYNTKITERERMDFENKLCESLEQIYLTIKFSNINVDDSRIRNEFLPLFQIFNNQDLVKISKKEYSRLTDIFSALNFDNIDVKTINGYLKNDCNYNIISAPKKTKINKIINNHVIANKEKMDLEGIGELYNILKITGEKKELLKLVLDTNDSKEIKDIFNDNLSSKESVMLLDNAINENNAFLAYNLLLNSNIIFMNKKDKKILEKIILESKDLKLIAKYALYINNNLINPIFGSIDNLYAYINKDNEIKVNKKDKKQYIKIKQKEIANKNNSKKKYVKALDLYLNNQKK